MPTHGNKLWILRHGGSSTLVVGEIDLSTRQLEYSRPYLADRTQPALSLSLPLREDPFAEAEFRPYLEGLLPEGEDRRSLAAKLAVRDDDYLAMLSNSLECMGDVAFSREPVDEANDPFGRARYEPIGMNEVSEALSSSDATAQASLTSRLSLTGTQHKMGLARCPGKEGESVWLRPLGGAASTHVLKSGQLDAIPELEYLVMSSASKCGVTVSKVELIALGRGRLAICVERFDRQTTVLEDGRLAVRRLHQEDLAQSLGIYPGSKYAELDPSSASAIAHLLRNHSSQPLRDIQGLARIMLLNYLVGNCDNHLKNLSLMHEGAWTRLAPAYDIVPTTLFDRFSRQMGMRIGRHGIIDEVIPEDFVELANELGISEELLRRTAKELCDALPRSIDEEGERQARTGFEALAYDAENLIADMLPRKATLESFAQR